MSENQINLGIVGLGRWGQRYIETIERLWPEGPIVLKYVAGRNSPPSQDYEPRKYFSHWEYLVFQRDIDGLIIASPAPTHFQVAAVALARKLPTLIEKPVTTTVRETVALLNISAASKTPALVGHQHLFAPAFQMMTKMLEGQSIVRIEGIAGGPGPVRDDCNTLWDWAPHDLGMVFTLCPATPPSIKRVSFEKHDRGAETWRFGLKISDTDIDITLSSASEKKQRWLKVFTKDGHVLVYDDRAEHKLTINEKPIPISAELPLDRLIRHFVMVVGDTNRGLSFRHLLSPLLLSQRIANTIEAIEKAAR